MRHELSMGSRASRQARRTARAAQRTTRQTTRAANRAERQTTRAAGRAERQVTRATAAGQAAKFEQLADQQAQMLDPTGAADRAARRANVANIGRTALGWVQDAAGEIFGRRDRSPAPAPPAAIVEQRRGPSPVVIVAGVAALGLVAFLLMREEPKKGGRR